MKKRGILVMTVLVVMAMLFASCSSNLSESAEGEGGSSAKAVKINLSLGGEAANINQKAVALDGGSTANYTYFYKAYPNWTSENIRGKTINPNDNNFIPVGYDNQNHNYEDDFALGYFVPGNWTFEVEIRAAIGTTVLYTGTNADVPISNALKEVIVPMTIYEGDNPQQQHLTGTVNIKVAVPKISGATRVTMDMDAIGSTIGTIDPAAGTTGKKIDTQGTITDVDGWVLFENEDISVETGNHTFFLTYKDNGNNIGGAAIAFTVKNGETYNIWGTIENGQYQIAALTLTGVKLDLTMTTDPNAATVAMDESYECTVNEQDCDTYVWTVNGIPAAAQNPAYQFTLPTLAPGVYEVTCIATKNGAIGQVSKEVTVTPPANLINIISKVDNAGANIKTAVKESTIVCTPLNIPGGSTVTWYVDGTPQTAGVTNNVFTFDNTTSTTKTGTAGTYKIVCKATNNGTVGYGEKTITLTNN